MLFALCPLPLIRLWLTMRSAWQFAPFGGGDGVPPVVLKALFADQSLAVTIGHFVRTLWNTPASQWCDLGLDGPGLQVPLWKQKEPFNSMDKWRGVVLLWTIPRVLTKIVNKRGQDWFEQTALLVPSSFGFRRGLGTDDALFMVRRLNEEISAWQSFGWNEVSFEAGLMDSKYPSWPPPGWPLHECLVWFPLS